MKPIYVDIHIHTSENPNAIKDEYNVELLVTNVKSFTGDVEHILGLSDHNILNKVAYLKLKELADNTILCAELHIRNYKSKPPYHCHILFNLLITEENIDIINKKLNTLYPDRMVTNEDDVPHLEDIINEFDGIEFMLLPHGGQSHKTFNESIPQEVMFDTTLERSIYYNHFEGFTARSNIRLEQTLEYFKRLGIDGFVNLLTCTDNYNPGRYPEANAKDAAEFIPTWMLAKPTFNGLRLSLSEADRFVYSNEVPSEWSESIGKISLQNEFIDINANLTPGLNVVIGGSSTGKTLFVDSLYKKISNDFTDSNYLELEVENIDVVNPSGIVPHYISQNYITEIINKAKDGSSIEDIEIISKVFNIDEEDETKAKTRDKLKMLKDDLHMLIDQVKTIQIEEKSINKIALFPHLLEKKYADINLIDKILPTDLEKELIDIPDEFFKLSHNALDNIRKVMNDNPFSEMSDKEIEILHVKLKAFETKKQFEVLVRELLANKKSEIDTYLSNINKEAQVKKRSYKKLLSSIKKHINAKIIFDYMMEKISTYSFAIKSKEIEVEGHKLYIENNLSLNKDTVVETFNQFLKSNCKIDKFEDITPHSLFKVNYKRNPDVTGYDNFVTRVAAAFDKNNKKNYRIVTKRGKPFEKLSAGWKASILLDLILGYKEDCAPLIIDQPEDNLAPNYINNDLVKSIKNIKGAKQILLVSHNATIPMLGDAQNIILCREINGKIVIRSAALEEDIEGKSVVDYIASITDGGKSSIKKRVKKYNLKRFRGDE